MLCRLRLLRLRLLRLRLLGLRRHRFRLHRRGLRRLGLIRLGLLSLGFRAGSCRFFIKSGTLVTWAAAAAAALTFTPTTASTMVTTFPVALVPTSTPFKKIIKVALNNKTCSYLYLWNLNAGCGGGDGDGACFYYDCDFVAVELRLFLLVLHLGLFVHVEETVVPLVAFVYRILYLQEKIHTLFCSKIRIRRWGF